MKKSVFEIITERVLSLLNDGIIPWRKPWKVAEGAPMNLVSKKPYRGINVWLLASLGYSSPWFLTFKQAQALGGSVNSGERGCPVVFWNFTEKAKTTEDRATGETKTKNVKTAFLRYYTVFHISQCTLPESKLPPVEEPVYTNTDPIESAEAIVAAMPNRPTITETDKDRACYSPAFDVVNIPRPEFFENMAKRYGVLLHELCHATGAASRLNRPGIANFDRFGSEQYGLEELVAEFGSSFLMATAGIEAETLENSAAYIQNWSKAIKKDPRMIIMAAAQGEKAARYILGDLVEIEDEPEIEGEQIEEEIVTKQKAA